MTTVYVLEHVTREFELDEDVKMLGVYSSEEEAKKAISRLAKQAGFRDHLGGFQCEPYELNKDHWTEGFVTVVTDAQH